MPSPFPGMNPYLERDSVWRDFHGGFLHAAKAWLNVQITPRYYAKTEEHVFIENEENGSRRIAGISDVSVTKRERPARRVRAVAAVLEPPIRGRQPDLLEERLGFIEVRDRDSQSLVTVIELLSPTNKHGGVFRDQYIAKQEQYLASTAHLVEIDLLRRGPRMPWIGLPACDYCAVVSRVEERPEAGIWPIRLRESFPKVPVPLNEADADASLDLKAILDRVYDESFYGNYIYDHSPEPPLRADDDEWARQILAT
jgi:hypothetical protein